MISGQCDARFIAVKQEFERNFTQRNEIGASVCLTFEGKTVVDLWGGYANPITKRAWESDTLSIVWSSTKGAAALCVHILAARGQLDLQAPVATYWPEFARAGKSSITVAMLLSHQSGLAALTQLVDADFYLDWSKVISALVMQQPLWEPGTRHGYHALTFGHLLGEIVRRVSGKSIGQFFNEEVANPLGLDFWIGLPEAQSGRLAPVIAPSIADYADSHERFFRTALEQTGSIPNLIVQNSGGIMHDGAINLRSYQEVEIPAANGVTNARGLASMYRPLALDGSYGGCRLLPRDAISLLSRVYTAGIDLTLGVSSRFSLGFIKTSDTLSPSNAMLYLSEDAFGHTGSGGSIGFADPRAELSFGYTMNKMGPGIALNQRGQSLIDAAYLSLGYRRSKFDNVWLPPN